MDECMMLWPKPGCLGSLFICGRASFCVKSAIKIQPLQNEWIFSIFENINYSKCDKCDHINWMLYEVQSWMWFKLE